MSWFPSHTLKMEHMYNIHTKWHSKWHMAWPQVWAWPQSDCTCTYAQLTMKGTLSGKVVRVDAIIPGVNKNMSETCTCTCTCTMYWELHVHACVMMYTCTCTCSKLYYVSIYLYTCTYCMWLHSIASLLWVHVHMHYYVQCTHVHVTLTKYPGHLSCVDLCLSILLQDLQHILLTVEEGKAAGHTHIHCTKHAWGTWNLWRESLQNKQQLFILVSVLSMCTLLPLPLTMLLPCIQPP